MVSKDFIRQLEGYGLTTANILYRLPDHPHLLQTFIWQEYDLAPKFPVLHDFLAFWSRELEGPLLLLASEAGSYITGSVIVADGGHLVSTL